MKLHQGIGNREQGILLPLSFVSIMANVTEIDTLLTTDLLSYP